MKNAVYEKQIKHLQHIQAHILEGKLSKFKHNHFLIFLACIIWLVMRSGRKPTRLAYPCQQMAAITVTTYLGLAFLLLHRWIIAFLKENITPRLTIKNAVIVLSGITKNNTISAPKVITKIKRGLRYFLLIILHI